ncbi:hypothetical protein BDY21DRAFT_352763 [Lineolata rhizophorae]|uniref:Mif2/CENP-C like-domain-containing protein n=1 Tax=Lineolata rhizophorae TaxID=578093 RepID=A0A6A6NS60_9PEZI|nr:hypothetical protein BDY21DRAFT_352763 [Lineolata rhizophorae]
MSSSTSASRAGRRASRWRIRASATSMAWSLWRAFSLRQRSRRRSATARASGPLMATRRSPPRSQWRRIRKIPGSAPEPTDYLSGRKLNGSTRLPPPAPGRSPIKTNLGSSPRRQSSMGPGTAMRASSLRASPKRAGSHPAVARRLDFGADVPHQSIELSPARATFAAAPKPRGRTLDEAFDIPPSPPPRSLKRTRGQAAIEEEEEPETREKEEMEEMVAREPDPANAPTPLPVDDSVADVRMDDAPMPMISDDEEQSATEIAQQRKTRGHKARKSAASDMSVVAVNTRQTAEAPLAKKKPGRPRKQPQDTTLEAVDETETAEVVGPSKRTARGKSLRHSTTDESDTIPSGKGQASVAAARQRNPGRRPKSALQDQSAITVDLTQDNEETTGATDEVEEDQEEEETPAPPPKRGPGRPKRSSSKVRVHRDAADSQPPPKKSRKGSRPPVERDMNIGSHTEDAGEKRNVRARSLQILRQGTPLDEAVTTRSGRASIKPLDWWKGERVERDVDGTIQGITRAEDVDIPKRRRQRKGPGRPKMAPIAEEEEELEEWEEEPGILAGFVNVWDQEANGAGDDEREEDLAFSSRILQTREVSGAEWRYAKILNVDFFGAGIVDLPPGGLKRSKNSRNMQMVFFLHSGTVTTRIGDHEFTIHKGGVWQVPRGELAEFSFFSLNFSLSFGNCVSHVSSSPSLMPNLFSS